MTDKIEPALTAEEWASIRQDCAGRGYPDGDHVATALTRHGEAGAIALANDLLPDSDPRKITREKVRWLRMALQGWGGELDGFADALESYLPPE